MSTTPRNNRRRKTSLLSKARWAGYAAAGAATALGTYEAAEAGVWWSGLLNGGQGFELNAIAGGPNPATYAIDLPGNSGTRDLVMYHHKMTATSDSHVFGLAVANTVFNHNGTLQLARIAGAALSAQSNYINAQRFYANDMIDSNLQFLNFGTLAVDKVASCSFASAVDGYIGFSFKDNNDTRYGWLRVITSGGPENSFKIMEYAYGGPNEGILAGVPEPGSLGLLATGGIGLLLWRKRRAKRQSA